MKRAFIAAGLLALSALCAGPIVIKGPTLPAAAGGPVYILDEDCEGTGAPAGWSNNGNWDYSTIPLVGSQSWGHVGATIIDEYTISDSDNYTAIVACRVTDGTPGAQLTIFGLRTSALVTVCGVQVTTSGNLVVFTGGSASTATVSAISDATTFYCKLVWVDGGTCSVEFSPTLSFSGSGNAFTSKTGGTTADCTRFVIGTTASTANFYIDEIQLSVSDIP